MLTRVSVMLPHVLQQLHRHFVVLILLSMQYNGTNFTRIRRLWPKLLYTPPTSTLHHWVFGFFPPQHTSAYVAYVYLWAECSRLLVHIRGKNLDRLRKRRPRLPVQRRH
jgi:hypothetical protein